MKERIIQVIELYELSPSKFADELGIQRSGISHILSGRNNPSLDLVQKILQHFPDINPDWIVTGKGAMLKSAEIMNPNQISIFDIDAVKASMEAVKTATTPKPVMAPKKANNPIPTNALDALPIAEFKEPEPFAVPTAPMQSEEKPPAAIAIETLREESITEQTLVRKIERIVIFYTDGTFTTHNQQ